MVYDNSSIGNKAVNRCSKESIKANVDVFPRQLYMKCGKFEIFSDGTPQNTKVLIDGKEARGVYSLKINLNTQRLTKVELGVYMSEFDFQTKDREEK